MRPLFGVTLVTALAIPAVAHAAPQPGSYSGTSSGRYIQVGQASEPTDKGKVTFKVQGDTVRDFRLRKQLVQCGPPAEVPVTVKKIALDGSGKGTATYEDPSIGALRVSITVTARGRASGKIVRPEAVTGLCSPEHPVRFSAKRG